MSSGGTGGGQEQVSRHASYMAPEQAQAKATEPARGRVPFLGMMLREMLVGKKPSGDGQQALAI